jgi:hypothetical protein
VKRFKELRVLLITLAIAFAGYLILIPRKEKQPTTPSLGNPIQTNPNDLILKKVFDNSEFKQFTPYLIAQAKLESANYKSPLFKLYKNAYAMNCTNRMQGGSSGRDHLQVGCSNKTFDGYERDGEYTYLKKGVYNSLADSGKDMILWLRFNRSPTSFSSPAEYVEFLKSKSFFEVSASNYLKALQSWI